jgi:hypothetical protein
MTLRHIALCFTALGSLCLGFGIEQAARGFANGWSMFITLGVMIDGAVAGVSLARHYRKYGHL